MDKIKIKDSLINNIYHSIDEIYTKNYNELINHNLIKNNMLNYRNPLLLKTNLACYFKHNDIKYWNDDFSERDKLVYEKLAEFRIIQLSKDLTLEFDKVIKQIKNLSEKKKYIDTYIRNVLNEIENLADIQALLPLEAHQYIPNILFKDTKFNIRTLTDDEVSEFKEDNKEYLTLFQVKLLNKFMVKK